MHRAIRLTLIALVATLQLRAAAWVVVVNKSNPMQSITRAQLKKMITGASKKWPDGSSLSVLTPAPGSAERKAVFLEVCGMTEDQFNMSLMQASFKGDDRTPPKSLPNGKIVTQLVQLTPGAIGIVGPGDANVGVKVIEVQ